MFQLERSVVKTGFENSVLLILKSLQVKAVQQGLKSAQVYGRVTLLDSVLVQVDCLLAYDQLDLFSVVFVLRSANHNLRGCHLSRR